MTINEFDSIQKFKEYIIQYTKSNNIQTEARIGKYGSTIYFDIFNKKEFYCREHGKYVENSLNSPLVQ